MCMTPTGSSWLLSYACRCRQISKLFCIFLLCVLWIVLWITEQSTSFVLIVALNQPLIRCSFMFVAICSFYFSRIMIVKCHFFFVLWIPRQFTELLCEFQIIHRTHSKKIQNNKRGCPDVAQNQKHNIDLGNSVKHCDGGVNNNKPTNWSTLLPHYIIVYYLH
jgi:hypothetical protein